VSGIGNTKILGDTLVEERREMLKRGSTREKTVGTAIRRYAKKGGDRARSIPIEDQRTGRVFVNGRVPRK